MTAEDEVEAWRQVIRTVDVAPDLQLHVSVLTVDDEPFAEIRNWILSNRSYGRGVIVPLAAVRQLRDGLNELLKETR